MSGDDKGYVVARRTLVAGLRALRAFPPSSIVLVGAHAVYHHAPNAVAAMTPFTLDADLAVDPRIMDDPRRIRKALEAEGFSLRSGFAGLYRHDRASEADEDAARLDVFVPEAYANAWSLDKYDRHASLATFSQAGLELCLLDHAPGSIRATDSDPEYVEVEVAGVLALLVAKGFKVGERYQQGVEPFRSVLKDIADIYRLLLVADFAEIVRKVAALDRIGGIRQICSTGASEILRLCGTGGAGSALLESHLGDSTEASIIVASLESLSVDFGRAVRDALETANPI